MALNPGLLSWIRRISKLEYIDIQQSHPSTQFPLITISSWVSGISYNIWRNLPFVSTLSRAFPRMATVKPVLRRSHTKSKNGCQACKRQHVKCDEFQPAWFVGLIRYVKLYKLINIHSNNCLLSGRTCIYLMQDMEKSGDTAPFLWWPTTVEQSCRRWKESGEPPFPVLNLAVSPGWHNMPMTDLRYLHQMALVASILDLSKTREMCLLWSEFST
jgi:hypothetical protein